MAHMTQIYTMDERTGKIENRASYSIDAKEALIAFIMQERGNYNTWLYPPHIEGIRESSKFPGRFYYDDIPRGRIIAACPY